MILFIITIIIIVSLIAIHCYQNNSTITIIARAMINKIGLYLNYTRQYLVLVASLIIIYNGKFLYDSLYIGYTDSNTLLSK